eukprot:g960.t1
MMGKLHLFFRFLCLLCIVLLHVRADFLSFPHDFIWGIAQDAYQFEGSPPIGKSSIDVWCKWNSNNPKNITHQSRFQVCGDVGAGFYANMKDDISLMAKFGQKHLNFEVSWSRLFPNGQSDKETKPDSDALQFYTDLVDALLENEITPWISLFVFDNPQIYTHQFGAWVSKKMVPKYGLWADFIFETFGDKVKHFFSFHEPDTLCSVYANPWRFVAPRPNINDTSIIDYSSDHYNCLHNMLLGHAYASKTLKELQPQNTLSIISATNSVIANTSSVADKEAQERAYIWQLGAWFDPVVFGDYPKEMRIAAGDRLPKFTPEESKLLRKSATYLGINTYTTMVVAANGPFPCQSPSVWKMDGMGHDACFKEIDCTNEKCGNLVDPINSYMNYFRNYPSGVASILKWVGERYGKDQKVILAETGVGLDGGSKANPKSSGNVTVSVNDQKRINYLKQNWAYAHLALAKKWVNLSGLFHWSFLDNIEWYGGYGVHFGLVYVEHDEKLSTYMKRTPKQSAYWYKSVIENNGFEMNEIQ